MDEAAATLDPNEVPATSHKSGPSTNTVTTAPQPASSDESFDRSESEWPVEIVDCQKVARNPNATRAVPTIILNGQPLDEEPDGPIENVPLQSSNTLLPDDSEHTPWFWPRSLFFPIDEGKPENLSVLAWSIFYMGGLLAFLYGALVLLGIFFLALEAHIDVGGAHSISGVGCFSAALILLPFTVPISLIFFTVSMITLVTTNRKRLKMQGIFKFIWVIGLILIIVLWCFLISSVTIGIEEFRHILRDLNPRNYNDCVSRVNPGQSALFEAKLYLRQFHYQRHQDSHAHNLSFTSFNQTAFHLVQADQNLCGSGFKGEMDIYGLGMRISQYLQWISALMANNLLSQTRLVIYKVYGAFLFVICLTTYVQSFRKTCVFSLEIELTYWLFWGGFICVFMSSPNPIKFGPQSKWEKLCWERAVMAILLALMGYHAAWYTMYAYDVVFPRMPCGTYHFFFGPLLNPSSLFFFVQDWIVPVFGFALCFLLICLPFWLLILTSEIKNSIRESEIISYIFGIQKPKEVIKHQITRDNQQLEESWSTRAGKFVREGYQSLREHFGLPANGRPGIFLITPLDVQSRRKYRIICAGSGIASCVTAIVGIELTLKWNKVTDVNSIAPPGQYAALCLGIFSLVTTFYDLMVQEAIRRRYARVRQSVEDEQGDDIELQPVSNNPVSALRYAFSQPDVAFLTHDGALPLHEPSITQSPGPTSSLRPATKPKRHQSSRRRRRRRSSRSPQTSEEGGYYMSGGLSSIDNGPESAPNERQRNDSNDYYMSGGLGSSEDDPDGASNERRGNEDEAVTKTI